MSSLGLAVTHDRGLRRRYVIKATTMARRTKKASKTDIAIATDLYLESGFDGSDPPFGRFGVLVGRVVSRCC